VRRVQRLWRAVALAGALAALAACQTVTPAGEPVASQVALRLTLTASVTNAPAPTAVPPTALPTASATATPAPTQVQAATATDTATPSNTPTPSITPTPSSTPSPTHAPRATVQLGSLPRPPAAFGGDSHFLFSDPGIGFIASSYRYGSVGPGQAFAPHHGADFSAPAGTPIQAVANGAVYYAGNDLEKQFGPQLNFYGNLVVIQLAQGWNGHTLFALYGHMSRVDVQTGQAVSAGDVVGAIGATGVALGPHAHLEAREDAPESYWDTRNPELWLQPLAGTGTLALRVTTKAGFFLPGVHVTFTCGDGSPRFLDTYWYSGVNPDDVYGENAAMMGLPPGFCHFAADIAGEHVALRNVQIKVGEVAFAWLQTTK
jgi:murein DD-endopeptidase MepM/ murein hydrolase activator NlpD